VTKESEDLDFDHLYPYDLGGPMTVENIQRLCRPCNTSKGNKIQCRTCNHWMTPDKSRCSQCETPLLGSKYSQTLKGRLEHLFQKVGLVAVISGAIAALLILVTSVLVLLYFVNRNRSSDQAGSVNTIVNESFNASYGQPAKFKMIIPSGAKNSRVVGGFKVTSGTSVSFYVVGEAQLEQWSSGAAKPALVQREQTTAAKIRQPLQAGTMSMQSVKRTAEIQNT
jgi:HNH endonuclease